MPVINWEILSLSCIAKKQLNRKKIQKSSEQNQTKPNLHIT